MKAFHVLLLSNNPIISYSYRLISLSYSTLLVKAHKEWIESFLFLIDSLFLYPRLQLSSRINLVAKEGREHDGGTNHENDGSNQGHDGFGNAIFACVHLDVYL